MATIGGIGYQAESISSPNISAEAGLLGVRADVTSAQAGMRQVARAGAEVETLADKIVRQEDMTAVLEAKNESAIALNQGLIDFQSKITGDFTRDRTEWEAIASKIGQEHVKRLGSPVREQSFSKEFDSMHKASIIKIQNASLQNQMARFETASAGHFANAAKSAMGIVQAGPENYPAQVDAQFKSYEDIINASPLLSQAEKDSKVQAARQTFYLEVAKFQAETTPGAFSRDWRDGVWTKHLTPEAVVGLQKYAESAETTNLVRGLQLKHGANTAAAIREALSPAYGEAHGITVEQQQKIAAPLEGLSNFNWQQQQRAKSLAEESWTGRAASLVAARDFAGLTSLANNPNASPGARMLAARQVSGGMENWRGNDSLHKQTILEALNGDIGAQDIINRAGPQGLSMSEAQNALAFLNKTPQEDKDNFALALQSFKAENGDKDQQAQFMSVLRAEAAKNGVHGANIKILGDELMKDTSWIPFVNDAPYLKKYEEMQNGGQLPTRMGGQFSRQEQDEATQILRNGKKAITPANIAAVVNGIIRKRGQ